MSSINSVNQSLFVNRQAPDQAANKASKHSAEEKAPLVIEADFVQTGSQKSIEQADAMFSRANDYAKLSEHYSPKAQQGIQAYNALEVESKRDHIRGIMGVDIYA